MVIDDYYSSINGQYLGSDGALTDDMRLIDDETFQAISGNNDGNLTSENATIELQGNSQVITIEEGAMQEDIQEVRDNSASSGNEHQVYIVLNRESAVISSTSGPTGNNSSSTIEYYPAPKTGVNFETPGGRIIIGQVHGHPKTTDPNKVNTSGMSDHDATTAADMNMSIYAVDAYTGGKCKSSSIHRVTSDGTESTNIGKTNGRHSKKVISIGRDALETWGGRR